MSETKTATVTREVWLRNAAELLRPLFAEHAATVPNVHVSVGFPKSRGRRAIGQCWDGQASEDGQAHVFICPTQTSAVNVLGILTHELVHASVGCACGHKGPFAKLARKLGLAGKLTATVPGPILTESLRAIAEKLGAYPHAALAVPVLGSKGSTLRKFECSCGIKVRVGRDTFDATCNLCGSPFERKS